MKYSGKQIDQAGRELRQIKSTKSSDEFLKAMDIMSYWRASHNDSLELAFEKIQQIALEADKNTIFAKRLKRAPSIGRKLKRFENMTLRNMQDIGGCRAVFSTEKKLRKALRAIKNLPEIRWEDGRFRLKDYINEPQDSGYRGVHIIGRFKNNEGDLRRIEIQLRTRVQHDWATSLEIVDLFTGQALKSNAGDEEWNTFFSSISDQFAIMDNIPNYSTLNVQRKHATFRSIVLQRRKKCLDGCRLTNSYAKKLKVVDQLNAFSNSLKIIDEKLDQAGSEGFILLRIDIPKTTLYSNIFEASEGDQAEAAYVSLEKQYATEPDNVVALVSATSVGGIKEAYPNFFADSSNFLQHLKLIMNL